MTEFDHAYLEALSWTKAEANGLSRPPGRFEHEGHQIIRNATPQRSNSGKSISRWVVTFHVTPPDGETYVVPDPGSSNRRNDPDRNWGLGRD